MYFLIIDVILGMIYGYVFICGDIKILFCINMKVDNINILYLEL